MEKVSLNGTWSVIYDDGNIGVMLGYQDPEIFRKNVYLETMKVPSCLEEFRQDYEGVAWYLRSFHARPDWKGKCVRLHFGAVNFRSEVWINGIPVGVHEGGYTPFEFEVGDILDFSGENTLVVRVLTPIITKEVIIDGLQRDEAPHWRGAITGGIWQDVDLYVNQNEYLKNIFVSGDIHTGRVCVSGVVVNPSLKSSCSRLSFAIRDYQTGEQVAEQSDEFISACGENKFSMSLHIKDFKYWSPDEPNLYQMIVRIGESDEQTIRFGMREFTVSGTKFMLNGKPIYLKSAFCEGLYPNTLSYPDDPEMIKREIRLAKEAGMNLLRPWRKPQLQEVYDYADEMGMMYISAPPIECMKHWPKATPYMETRIMHEIREMILRDRNHPCIIVWELFNEIRRIELARYKHKASVLARRLDPTRAIIDESGGNSNGANLYLPYESQPTPFNDIHIYPGAYIDDKTYDKIHGFSKTETTGLNSVVKQGLLSIVTEIGYGSPGMLTQLVEQYDANGNPKSPDYRTYHMMLNKYKEAFERYGFQRIYNSLDDFFASVERLHAQANLLMTGAARTNDLIGGIGIHALTDGDWVIGAGLLDVYRRPKAAYDSARKLYANHFLNIRTNFVNFYTGQQLEITFTPVNDHKTIEAQINYHITNEQGNVIFSGKQEFVLEHGINQPIKVEVDTQCFEGICEISAELFSKSTLLCGNCYEVCAVAPTEVMPCSHKDIFLYNVDERLESYLRKLGANVKPYTPGVNGVIFFGLQSLHEEKIEERRRMVECIGKEVENGSSAVCIEFDQMEMPRGSVTISAGELLPFEVKRIHTQGAWTPFNRCILKDAYTRGIPANRMMDNLFHNLAPHTSLDMGTGEWTVGGIGYDYGKDLDHNNYLGVAEPQAFADLVTRQYGKGKYILSSLRIVENLGKDAFADVLLKNILSVIK